MKLILPEKVYEVIRWLVCVFIPALLVFYKILGNELDIPHTDTVITIGTAFDAFLGTIFMISKLSYDIKAKEDSINE